MDKIAITDKECLTINEASQLYNIGVHKIRELIVSEDCPFVLYVGRKALIKKEKFNSFIGKTYSI